MPAVTRRQYKGAAAQTTIVNALASGDTSATLAATTGFPSAAGVPFFVVISPGTASEEKCLATISGSVLTLTRAQDDTTAGSHASGATIYPVFTADDADEANLFASTMTTRGDLLTMDSGPNFARLAVGGAGALLKSNGTDPAYLALGAADTVLTSDGTDASWSSNIVVSPSSGTGVDATVDSGEYGFRSRTNSTDANGSYLGFFKARGTAGSQTVVSDGDDIGMIRFFAYDGDAMREAARIKSEVDGGAGASDMPGALSFFTTADGGATLSERMRINNAGLITGTGTSLGAWTAFTPTWTNLTVGNATQTWVYCQLGKLVFVRGILTWGSTTSATGSATAMSLPVNLESTLFRGLGEATFVDSGTQTYWGQVTPSTSSRVAFNTQIISGSYAVSSGVTSAAPFTWTTADSLQCQFMYEAA
jgi:hypothetical protein